MSSRASTVRIGALLLPVAVALVAYRTSPTFGLLADAQFLIADNVQLDDFTFERARDLVTHDYFHSASGNAIPYWRPLTKLSWWLEAQLFGRDLGAGYHLVQLLWHALGALGVSVLALRLGASLWAATAMACLYAVHPAAVEPVCLVMARSDLAAVSAMLWSLVGFVGWLRPGATHAGAVVLHLGAAIVALGSKETAVVLLPAAALLGWAVRGPDWRGVALRLAPLGVLVGLLLWARGRVLTGQAPVTLELDGLRLLVGVARYLEGVMALPSGTGVRNTSFIEARAGVTLAWSTVVWLVLGLGLLWLFRRGQRAALSCALIGLGALLPVLLVAHVHVPGSVDKIPMADRWLLPAVAFFAVALAPLVPVLAGRARLLALAPVVIYVAVALIQAPAHHAAYADDAGLIALEEAHYRSTAPQYRTTQDDCRQLNRESLRALANGDPATVVARYEAAPRDCQVEPDLRFNRLAAEAALGRWPDVFRHGQAILAHPMEARIVGPTVVLTGVAALETGQLDTADALLTRADGLGLPDCRIPEQRARLAQLRREPGPAADFLLRAVECTGSEVKRATMRVLAVDALLAARRASEAQAQVPAARATCHLVSAGACRHLETLGLNPRPPSL